MRDEELCEIVEIVGECRLRDASGTEQVYWRRDGCGLAPGFYVVHWPQGAKAGRFGEQTLFEGPFADPGAAQAAWLGIKDAAANTWGAHNLCSNYKSHP